MVWKYCLCGAAAGAVNGLFGAGGGMVLVPLLIYVGKLEDQSSFSTSLAIILPLSVVTLLTYSAKTSLPVSDALPYLIGGSIGAFLGSRIFYKTPVNVLHKIFGGLILWGGFKLLLTA